MSDTAADAGARLRAAREKRGMSLLKAAGELHLEPWVVEALESGDLSRVGPPVYGKGFLRRYALLLGLAPDEILAGFGIVFAAGGSTAGSTGGEDPLRAPVSASHMLGGVAVVLVLAALVWWKPWSQPERDEHAMQPAAAPESTARAPEIAPDAPLVAPDPAPPPVATPATEAKSALPVMSHPNPQAAAVVAPADVSSEPGAGHVRLRLSFTADSWVEVRDAQGSKAFVGNNAANTVRSIAGQAPMHVYLRQGSGVQLEVNGHVVAIGPQFFAGDVARFQAGADGVLRREPPREANAANARPPG